MANFHETISLTHQAAFKLLYAAVEEAERLDVAQCIVVVDCSGETLASLRMDGAKYLSMRTARAKAQTAASINAVTGGMSFEPGVSAAVASSGSITNLPGGVPIRFDGRLAGAIGVGSGSGEQDFAVAHAAICALGADRL